MALYPPWLYEIGVAIMLFGVYSWMYKENPIYGIVEQLVIGVTAAHVLIMGFKSIQASIINPLIAGEIIAAGALILGLAYLCMFSRTLVPVYRLSMIMALGVAFGRTLPTMIATLWGGIRTYSQVTEIGIAVSAICMCLVFVYCTFWRRIDTSFRPVRTLGLAVIYIYFGINLGAVTIARTSILIGQILEVSKGVGLYVAAIAMILIFIDVGYQWSKTRGRQVAAV
jgi:hypothetical protein